MSEFVTVAYYDAMNPKSLLLKSRLESEGIHCFIKNEFGAYGRMGRRRPQLQIMDSQLEQALPILREMGFNVEQQNDPLESFDRSTKNIPIPLIPKLILMAVLIASLLCAFIYLLIPRK